MFTSIIGAITGFMCIISGAMGGSLITFIIGVVCTPLHCYFIFNHIKQRKHK